MTDATGTTAGAYTYSPYGALTAHAGAATTPLQYAGQYTDPETGLQYDRARYYDPVTGQFPTQDPLEAITQQPYAYADADPINETDPLGLCGSLASWGGFWANCGSDVTSAAGRAITSASQQTEPGALLGLASTITGHSLGICAGGEAGIGHVISAGGCYIATPTGPCLTVTSGNTSGGALGVNASGLLGSEQKCGEFGGHFDRAREVLADSLAPRRSVTATAGRFGRSPEGHRLALRSERGGGPQTPRPSVGA